MREALFSSLGSRLPGARFADLYAGSGAVGIEALSRGAALTVFVEADRRATEVIRENLANTRLEERGVLLTRRLPAAWGEIAQAHGPFDIVFADPPYASPDLPALAELLVSGRQGLTGPVVVVLQHEHREPVLAAPLPTKRKQWGQSWLDFYYLGGILPEGE